MRPLSQRRPALPATRTFLADLGRAPDLAAPGNNTPAGGRRDVCRSLRRCHVTHRQRLVGHIWRRRFCFSPACQIAWVRFSACWLYCCGSSPRQDHCRPQSNAGPSMRSSHRGHAINFCLVEVREILCVDATSHSVWFMSTREGNCVLRFHLSSG